MDSDTIIITDDNGNEKEFGVLFTFNSDEFEKSYVLYYDLGEDESEVYSSIYDEEGHLCPVETKEEWDMIEEVFQAFMAEDEG